MNAPHFFRIGMRLANGRTLVGSAAGADHDTLRAKVNGALQTSGLPVTTLLICIPGGQA
jgi:hypothetical protein